MIAGRHWAPDTNSVIFREGWNLGKCTGIPKTAKLGDLKGFTLDDG